MVAGASKLGSLQRYNMRYGSTVPINGPVNQMEVKI